MFDKLFRRKYVQNGQNAKGVQVVLGNEQFSISPTMNYYRYGSYDNTYANITRIAESFMMVEPYAINEKGEKIEKPTPLVEALNNPGMGMSGAAFREALIVMALVHPTVYLLCWRKEGRDGYGVGGITKDNIGGFTFLEDVTVDKTTGFKIYKVTDEHGEEHTYGADTVIEISLSVNPYDVYGEGYSPSLAAKRWASVDDDIAEYQHGHFKNGAKPAGLMSIVAPTVGAFNAQVDEIERHHRGAGKNNNMLYSHVPLNELGQTGASQITWTPFASDNKSLALKDIFDQANKKIDMTFGVPEEVKGYIQNSNYASVSVADYIFDKRVVRPKLVKIWTQIVSEMNRITGGLGYALWFDYDIPELAEEMQAKVTVKQTQLATLNSALMAGFTLESAVEALELPESFLNLKRDTNAFPKASEADETAPAEKSIHAGKSKAAGEEAPINEELLKLVQEHMGLQIDAAAHQVAWNLGENSEILAKDMLVALEKAMADTGAIQYLAGKLELIKQGMSVSDVQDYIVSRKLHESYGNYLKEIALSYDTGTQEAIKRVLEQAEFDGLTGNQIQRLLGDLVNNERYRAYRLAETETHRSNGLASIDAMTQLSEETGAQFTKKWHRNPFSDSCANCMDLDGKSIPLGESFVGEGDEFPDGSINDFYKVTEACAHPHCHCYLTYQVSALPTKTVKVTCPKCGRFMCDSTNATIEKMICSNSKCKANWRVKIINGDVKCEEIN